MAVVGVHIRHDQVRWITLERRRSRVVIPRDGLGSEKMDGSWRSALAIVADRAPKGRLAVCVQPPKAMIEQVKVEVARNPREVDRVIRIKAEKYGFSRRDNVRVIRKGDRWFFAAIKSDEWSGIHTAARLVRRQVSWIEHVAHCWARVVPPDFGAVLDLCGSPEIVIFGNQRAVMRQADPARRLAEDVTLTLQKAETTGFASMIKQVGVVGGTMTDNLDPYRAVPLRIPELPEECAPWAAAMGAALSALEAKGS